jgi:hypothetical protein
MVMSSIEGLVQKPFGIVLAFQAKLLQNRVSRMFGSPSLPQTSPAVEQA